MTITLTDIRFYAFHGVLPQERVVGGDYVVNVTVKIPTLVSGMMCTSCPYTLDTTINYADIYNVVKEEMDIPADLLEEVAWRIAKRLLTQWSNIEGGMVAVTKVNPPMGATMGGATVTIDLAKDM